jgi:Tol biopolymer transport system component
LSLSPGRELSHYRLVAPIGEGGMGVVWRATDTTLGRDVAVKVLPELFASDPERMARFEREARVLASLNHPHIASIYGVGLADGVRFLAMELVEGEDLAQRLARGPMPPAEAVEVARQVAEALESAHEKGVIHRDLKPANVKLTAEGQAKVLDFGLAKALEDEVTSSSNANMTHSPTLTSPMTAANVILGTAAYMSPEQARGRAVDRRADIWAFGCLLYECLTGRRTFAGETVSDTLAKILEREPDFSALPSGTPERVRDLLRRCLDKDARRRLRDIGDARIALEEVLASRTASGRLAPAGAEGAVRGGGGSRLAWVVAGILAVAVLALGGVALRGSRRTAGAMRVAVLPPATATIDQDQNHMMISPDGARIVFAAVDTNGVNQLWLRELESAIARPLPGTHNATLPFWSPDSRWIAFFADGRLKKVDVQGRTVQVLCAAPDGRGGSWGRRGTIVFAPRSDGGLASVPESGGDPVTATIPDTANGESVHRFPCFLPDGRHFLCVGLDRGDDGPVKLGRLGSTTTRTLLRAEGAAVYAAPGYLLFPRRGDLLAQRFDARSGRLSGEAVPVSSAPQNVSRYTGAPSASVSENGIIAQRNQAQRPLGLSWFDRSGHSIGDVPVTPDLYANLALSHDGSRAAIVHSTVDGSADVWTVELSRGLTSRVTSDFPFCEGPIWSPDDRTLTFATYIEGERRLYRVAASGAGRPVPILTGATFFTNPAAWSADGRTLFYRELDARTGEDVWAIARDDTSHRVPVLRSRFHEVDPKPSPDGHWLAYVSDESGHSELYLQSWPDPGVKIRVSSAGAGSQVRSAMSVSHWRGDGREIVFVSGDDVTVMAASVEPGPTPRVGDPRPLFRLPPGTSEMQMSRDGQRFLLLVDRAGASGASIHLLVNWTAVLSRR